MNSIGVIEIFFICLGGLIGSILCSRYKLGVGIYVIIGTILGPHVLNLISISYLSNTLSAIGILFVLFEIGLHLSYEKILLLKKYLPNSILSIVLSIVLVNLFLYFLYPSKTILLISMLLCISSTPVVYQLLVQNKKLYTKVGRFVFTVMILQDILSVILLINHNNQHSLLFTIVSTIIILGTIILVGNKIVNKIFIKLSDSFEFILFVSFLIIIGLSLLTEHMGLSLELGAVLAGFLLAETDYKDYIESQILNIKEVLLAIFFLTIGMSLPLEFFIKNYSKVLLMLFSILSLKFLGIFIGARIILLNNIQSITSGLMLLSVGEPVFIFVAKILPGLVPDYIGNYLLLITVISIIVSPMLFQIFYYFCFEQLCKKTEEKYKFMIIGGNDVTEIVMSILQKNDISYLCLENDLERVKTLKQKGYEIVLSDYKDTKFITNITKNANGIFFSYIPPKFLIDQIQKIIPENKNIYIKVKDLKEEEYYRSCGLTPIRIDIYDEAYKVCYEVFPQFGIDEGELEKVFLHIEDYMKS